MAFITEYMRYLWGRSSTSYDEKDLACWNEFLDKAEKDRQRECVTCCKQGALSGFPQQDPMGDTCSSLPCPCSRIVAWRDSVTSDNAAVNAEDPHYYRRTAG